MNIRFKNYLLVNTYFRITESQRNEVIHFWRQQRAVIDPVEAERRSYEVVFMVRAASGELVGVCTVGLTQLQNGRTYYAYRMFLRRQDRVSYLMRTVAIATRDFLHDFEHPQARPEGMLIVTENPKLMRSGIRRYFERNGCLYCGKTLRGQDVWVAEFDNKLSRLG